MVAHLQQIQHAALADVVIAPVWSTEEPGSIPGGGTKFTVLLFLSNKVVDN